MSYNNGGYDGYPTGNGFAGNGGFAPNGGTPAAGNVSPGEENGKKVKYSHYQFYRLKETTPDSGYGQNNGKDMIPNLCCSIFGFVHKVNVEQYVNSNNEQSVRASVTIDSVIRDNTVRYYLGEEFVDANKHIVRFRTTFYGYDAESISRANIKERDTVQLFLHHLSKSVGQTNDGKGYRIIDGKSAGELALVKRFEGNDAGRNATAPGASSTCTNCGSPITADESRYSAKHYGRLLCRNCQKQFQKQGRSSETAAPNAQYPSTGLTPAGQPVQVYQQPGAAPAQEYPQQQTAPQSGVACENCGRPLGLDAADYSWRNYHRYLCRDCQTKAVRQPAAAPQQSYAPPPQQGFSPAPQTDPSLNDLFEQGAPDSFYRG